LHTPESTPDGLTIDTNGNLWIAFFGGACVRHYDAGGNLLQQVDLPTPNITSCIFGGPDFGDLFITSAGGKANDDSAAGALFRIQPEVGGKAEFRSQISIQK
jgi:D-xylonolactonase